jgi:hypothetical protein
MNIEDYLNSPWAYTGSIAMKLHANRLGVPFPTNRKIGNMNIAVMHPSRTAFGLKRSGKWNFVNGNVPGPHSNHVKMSNGLNIFRLGGRLAGGPNRIQYVNGVPVMNLKSLLNKKRNAMNNAFTNRNKNKTRRNIHFLEKLISANTTKTVRTPPSSGKRRRSSPSPNKKNSFSTPPRGKKLVFF